MQRIVIPHHQNPKGLTKKQVERAILCSSGVIKVVTGVGNSAAHLVMLHALDQVKKHPNYRHKVKKAYNDAVAAMAKYKRGLLHPQGVRYFHLADLPPKERARFAPEATDSDYFDYWTNPGAVAYERTKPFITSLWNKYRLSLLNHGVKHEEIIAWVLTARAALGCAVEMYRLAIKDASCGYQLPEGLLRYFFHPFDLTPVAERWKKAVLLTNTSTYDLDEIEARNLEMGVKDLMEAWLDVETIFGSTVDSIEDYPEIFSTKGNQKRSAKNMAEVLATVKEELSR